MSKPEPIQEAAVLDCNEPTIDSEGSIGAAESALMLHAWAHRLWRNVSGAGIAATIVDMHSDAIRLGRVAGLEHVDCDALDATVAAVGSPGPEDSPG